MRFLLVHGTTQSPDGWQLLINELSAIGHSAVTTDLVRFGERMSATEYGDAIAAEQSGATVDVVVAHSGSGLLLPAIASATEAKLQVYLAAFVPDGSRSLLDELNDDGTAIFSADWIGVDPTTDHDAAHHFLFHDCTPDVAEWAVSTLRLFVPQSAYSGRVPRAAAIPSMSVVPDSDRTLRTEWMITATRERLGVEPTIVPGGHCPHVSRPRHLAQILATALEQSARVSGSSDVVFRVVDAGSSDANWALTQYFAELDQRFAGGFDTEAGLAEAASSLNAPSGLFVVATIGDDVVGCGAIQWIDGDTAEIKRMWVHSGRRGIGLGKRLLGNLEAEARSSGRSRVVLDTNESLAEAISMYLSLGYDSIERYNDNPYAHHWFEKTFGENGDDPS